MLLVLLLPLLGNLTVVHGYGGPLRRLNYPSPAATRQDGNPHHRDHPDAIAGCYDRRIFWQRLVGTTVATTTMGCSVVPLPSAALSPDEAATAYNSYAETYDALDAGQAASVLGIDEARATLFAKASGKVLEIGAGTGLNLYRYNPTQVTSLTLLDISSGMLQQAQQRLDQDPILQRQWKDIPIQWVQADATSELVSTFGPGTFDTVVDSFSLCVMGNEGAKQCLEQLKQVVKPHNNNNNNNTNGGGGKILLLENSRSTNPFLAQYQDVTATTAAKAGGKGCVYNQDVRAMIDATPGMVVEKEVAYAAGLFRSFECSVRL